MSLRKFISGVTAFAVAASAFAAMAVTASAAKTYKKAVTPGTLYRLVANKDADDKVDGTFTTYNNKQTEGNPLNYSGVIADLSDLENIDYATSVTVQFDTYVVGNDSKLAKIMYGVGDKKQRALTANGFRNHIGEYINYSAGLVTYFGSENGSTYVIKGKDTTYTAKQANGFDVRTVITLDRKEKKYSANIIAQKYNEENNTTSKINLANITDASTTVDNLTVIEAVTWGEATYNNFTLKDIKVSYTVPPYANLEKADWTVGPTTTGYTASGNVLTDTNENCVYGYKATLTADGVVYDSVKVAVTTNEDVPKTDTKTYSDYGEFNMQEGTAVFYVISDVELDISKSRVYCN